MQKKTMWWIFGGGSALYALYALNKPKPGVLEIRITGMTPSKIEALTNAVLASNETCKGLPKILKLTQPVEVVGGTGPAITIATLSLSAEFKGSVLGAIREAPRVCLEKYLQTFDAAIIDVTAKRVS
jgi:hypothetical protein